MLTVDLSGPSDAALTFEKVRSIAQVPQSPRPVYSNVIVPLTLAVPLLLLLSIQVAVPLSGTATLLFFEGVQTKLKRMPVLVVGAQSAPTPPLPTPIKKVEPPLLRKLSSASSSLSQVVPSMIGSKFVKIPRMRI